MKVYSKARCTTPNYKVKKKVVKSKNEWIRVENNHEPIITKEQFDKNRINQLNIELSKLGRTEDILKAAVDKSKRCQALLNF
nr:recombinase family protein [uncultured Mediterraneibacter sp.]